MAGHLVAIGCARHGSGLGVVACAELVAEASGLDKVGLLVAIDGDRSGAGLDELVLVDLVIGVEPVDDDGALGHLVA